MGIRIDMSGVSAEGGNFKPLDRGEYPAVISNITPGTSQAGKPKLEFEFTLDNLNGRKQWRNYSLTPNALWALKIDLVALGIEVPDGEFDLDIEQLLGMNVILVLGLKPHWQGKTDSDGNVIMENEIESIKPGNSW